MYLIYVKTLEREHKKETEKLREEGEWAWDDVKGGKLRVEDVKKARREEVQYMKKRGIWVEVPEEECWRKTGKGPKSVRWVDTNKGMPEDPDVRCRLVSRDFKGGQNDRDELFAATPPLEGLRIQCSRAVTLKGGKKVRKMGALHDRQTF